MPKPLPLSVTAMVGHEVLWKEDGVEVVDGEARLIPSEDVGLVLGARWARNVDGKPVGQEVGVVQLLMERRDGTTRWGPEVDTRWFA